MGERIVIVDDQAMHRMFARIVLQAEGYEVWEAGDACAAEDALVRSMAPLALVDLELPEVSGLELVRRLRAAAPGAVRLVAFTAHSGERKRAEALAAGFDAFLEKPVDSRGLLERVAQELAAGVAAKEGATMLGSSSTGGSFSK